MSGFAHTVIAWFWRLDVLPDRTQDWLGRLVFDRITLLHFQQLPPERQQQLRAWSRDELIDALRVYKLDPASGWLRHLTPADIELGLQTRSRIELLDEAGYLLPNPLPSQSSVSSSVSGSS